MEPTGRSSDHTNREQDVRSLHSQDSQGVIGGALQGQVEERLGPHHQKPVDSTVDSTVVASLVTLIQV